MASLYKETDGAFEGLSLVLRQHASWLQRVVDRRFRGAVSAEDIVQEAYLRLPRDGVVRHPRAFLLKVASRLALDQLRRQRRGEMWSETLTTAEPVTEDDPHQRVLLRQLLDGMPAICRETFILSRFGGFSYEEIAQRQHISVKAVEWRISKALAYCTARLEA